MAIDRRAHLAVKEAVSSNRLMAPTRCVCIDCGGQARLYHHESYEPERWLDVIPLCAPCHRRRHHGLPPQPRDPSAPYSLLLRLPPMLRARLQALADYRHRRLSEEALTALEHYVKFHEAARARRQRR